jgi:hypothetical protein
MKTAAVVMIFYMLVSVATICMIALLVQKPDRIPCDVAEISPDFSVADKEYCRRLRQRQSSSKHYL